MIQSPEQIPKYSSFLQHIARRLITLTILTHLPENVLSFLLWPVSKRLFKNYWEIVEVAQNVQLTVYGDMEDMVNKTLLFKSDFEKLSWEAVTARLVSKLASEVELTVVAGAHIGYYPLLVAKLNPNALVYAFEPNPDNYSKFEHNIELNQVKNIKTFSSALGATAGKSKMYFDFGQSSLVETHRKHGGEGNISVVKLDDIFQSTSGHVSLVILDAEGYEPKIIEGGLKTISSHKPHIIFELNPGALRAAGSSAEDLCLTISAIGYTIFIIDDNYTHSLKTKRDPDIKLIKYQPDLLTGVSFVNAFATMDPKSFGSYISS